MLSPSHPGPHKATHLTMRDRTYGRLLVPSALPLPVIVISIVVISNSVGVECRASATSDRADDCTFLTTNRSTYCRTCSGANRRGQLIAVPVPKRSFFPIATVVTASGVHIIPKTRGRNSLLVSSTVEPSTSRLSAGRDNRYRYRQQTKNS